MRTAHLYRSLEREYADGQRYQSSAGVRDQIKSPVANLVIVSGDAAYGSSVAACKVTLPEL